VLRVGGVRSGRPTHLRLHDKLRALNVLSTERRRTYSLNPDDTLADRAGVARAERAALTILRG
jgi:hypothetical protein